MVLNYLQVRSGLHWNDGSINDVDVRPAPTPPTGTKRVKPPNRLVDCHGWQEIYAGKLVWIYDSKSNVDQCVRLVGQQGAMYGTAS